MGLTCQSLYYVYEELVLSKWTPPPRVGVEGVHLLKTSPRVVRYPSEFHNASSSDFQIFRFVDPGQLYPESTSVSILPKPLIKIRTLR